MQLSLLEGSIIYVIILSGVTSVFIISKSLTKSLSPVTYFSNPYLVKASYTSFVYLAESPECIFIVLIISPIALISLSLKLVFISFSSLLYIDIKLLLGDLFNSPCNSSA